RNTPRRGFGELAPLSVTTWLIVVNVGVFVLDGLLRRHYQPVVYDEDGFPRAPGPFFGMGPLSVLGHFSIETAIYHFQIWRLVTFQFLHSGLGHLLGNMLALFLFGPIVESHFGPRRYFAFYLLCGIAGAASFVILWAIGILGMSPATPMVG